MGIGNVILPYPQLLRLQVDLVLVVILYLIQGKVIVDVLHIRLKGC